MFGTPGILLKVIGKGRRVVIVYLSGDYRNWAPVRGRHEQLLKATTDPARRCGAEARLLPFVSHEFEVRTENKKVPVEALAGICADEALMLWLQDTHNDHRAGREMCEVAVRRAGQLP